MERGIEMVGADNVTQIVTDSASVMIAAGRVITNRYPNISHAPCAAHLLDLWMEDVGKLQPMKELMEQANDLVRFVANHQKTLSLLREQTELRLKKSCQTR
jgi:hypothetical protein